MADCASFHSQCVSIEIIQPSSNAIEYDIQHRQLRRRWTRFNVFHPTVFMNLDHDGLQYVHSYKRPQTLPTVISASWKYLWNVQKSYQVSQCLQVLQGRSVKIWFSCETLIIKSSVFTTEREYTQRLKHSYNNHLSCSMLISSHKNGFDKD